MLCLSPTRLFIMMLPAPSPQRMRCPARSCRSGQSGTIRGATRIRSAPYPGSPLAASALIPEKPSRTDSDGHWKDALETWLQPCTALFWPDFHALIDWRIAPVFLDKELRRIGGSLHRDRLYVDKLAQLQTRDGPLLLLMHTEVQARLDQDFPARMFRYYSRLAAHYPRHDIVQFAIVTKSKNSRKICRLEHSYAPLTGNFLTLRYTAPVIHLQDWAGQEKGLQEQARRNPFAMIILAELQAAARPLSARRKLHEKIQLVRQLYQLDYTETDIRQLFLFIDHALRLPTEQDQAFTLTLEQLEQEQKVAYISSVERVWLRRGLEQGIEQGLSQTLATLLHQRFGRLPAELQQRLEQASAEQLRHWLLSVIQADSPQAVFNS